MEVARGDLILADHHDLFRIGFEVAPVPGPAVAQREEQQPGPQEVRAAERGHVPSELQVENLRRARRLFPPILPREKRERRQLESHPVEKRDALPDAEVDFGSFHGNLLLAFYHYYSGKPRKNS